MLRRLLRTHLGPYSKTLLLIVVLQTVQTTAALTLPTINARIIDKGVLAGNQGYIYTWGAVMLVFALIQIVFAVAAVYFGGKVAMSFGRDLRKNLFHQVTDFSAREVGTFGAPSLITRITNDVQQVQMLVVMACTMAIAAPITMVVGVIIALRQDVGLSVVLVVAMPVAAVVLGYRRRADGARVPADAGAHRPGQPRAARADHRHPRRARLRARAAGGAALRQGERRPDRGVAAGRPVDGVDVPDGELPDQRVERRACCGSARAGSNSGHIQVGTLIAYLTYLVQILMSVVMATFMVSMIPRASVSADRIQEVLDTDPSVVPPADPVREVVTHGALEFGNVGFHYPGAEHAVLTGITFATAPGQTTAIVGSTGAGKTTLVNLILRLFDSTEGDGHRSAASTCTISIPTCCGARSATCRSGRTSSRARREQPPVRQARRDRGRDVGPRSRSRRRATSCGRCPAGCTRASSRAARTCRAASASGCRSRGRSSAGPTSTCSTTRSRRSTSRPTRACAPRSCRTPRRGGGDRGAQRVSTIASADNILVLEDGVVIGHGTHEELLRDNPTYAEIVQSQIGEKSAAA